MNARSPTPSNGSAASRATHAADRSRGQLDRIQPQDLAKLQVKDRVSYGELPQVANSIVRFRRRCPASGWHHATARQVVAH